MGDVMKRKVRDFIKQKGLGFFVSVDPESSIWEALNVLRVSNSSALLVTEREQLRGLFSEKDFARSLMNREISLKDSVRSVMTTRIFYVEPDFTLEDCLQIMSKVHVSHLPVLERGLPLGLISMRNIVQVLVDEKDAQIRELTTYIGGPGAVLDFQGKRPEIPIPIFGRALKQGQEAL